MLKRKIGIIGAGRLGTALARALSKANYEVAVSNSKGKDSLILQLEIMLPGVTALDTPELMTWADIVILALPLPRYTLLPLELLQGKIVVDAMNYWAPVDGKLPEFEAYAGSSSELVAASIPGASVVKSFNSVAYGELEEHAMSANTPGRRAIPLAGNDDSVKIIISELIHAIGFEPVDLGSLAQGNRFQPDTKLFNQRLTKAEILSL